MFDRYMIVEDSLRRTPDGFELDVRIPYSSSTALSTIEALEVRVDGCDIPRDAIRFVLRGRELTQDELERDADTRWEFGEIATLRVHWPDGLRPGPHDVEQSTQLRISHFPAPVRGHDRKAMVAA